MWLFIVLMTTLAQMVCLLSTTTYRKTQEVCDELITIQRISYNSYLVLCQKSLETKNTLFFFLSYMKLYHRNISLQRKQYNSNRFITISYFPISERTLEDFVNEGTEADDTTPLLKPDSHVEKYSTFSAEYWALHSSLFYL